MTSIKENIEEVRNIINESANKVNRDSKEVTLLAVTKTVDTVQF